MESTYDLASRLKSLKYPDSKGALSSNSELVTYGYDTAGRVKSLSGYVTDIQYKPNDRLKSIVYTNQAKAEMVYDPQRQWLTSSALTERGGSNAALTTTYRYDAVGRVTRQAIGQGVEDYEYDSLSRLLAACGKRRDGVTTIGQRYSYDSIGNMTENSDIGTYKYPAPKSLRPHAVSTTSRGSFLYDANGNLERELDLSGVTKRQISWDHDNRPLQIDTYGTNVSTVINEYDGAGNRVYKTNPSRKRSAGSEP